VIRDAREGQEKRCGAPLPTALQKIYGLMRKRGGGATVIHVMTGDSESILAGTSTNTFWTVAASAARRRFARED